MPVLLINTLKLRPTQSHEHYHIHIIQYKQSTKIQVFYKVRGDKIGVELAKYKLIPTERKQLVFSSIYYESVLKTKWVVGDSKGHRKILAGVSKVVTNSLKSCRAVWLDAAAATLAQNSFST